MSAQLDIPESIVDAQVQRLLDIVQEYQTQQCDELLFRAQDESRQIVRQAYHEARQRLHQDIQHSRNRMQQELFAMRAKQHTMMMQQRHQAERRFLNQSWELLAEKLLSRWAEEKQRSAWIKKIILAAHKVIPGRKWQVEFPDQMSKQAQQAVREQITESYSPQASFVAVSSIQAGLRISADGAVVDGSLQGLMTNRGRIESLFLAQCKDCLRHSVSSKP